MTYWKLQKYQLSIGNSGQIVRVVKELLNLNPISSYRMDGTDIFDTKLKEAIAEFQYKKQLPNKNGALDMETWMALCRGISRPILNRLASTIPNNNEIYNLLTSTFNVKKFEADEKVVIHYLGDEQETVNKIKDVIAYASNKADCSEAFRVVGAIPIENQLDNLTIVTQQIFKEPIYDSLWTKGSDIGEFLRNIFNENTTTSDVSIVGEYKDTGRRFIGITNAAIEEKIEYLDVVVIHSLLHSGGVPGKKIGYFQRRAEDMWITGYNPPDLHYLGKKYDDVINASLRNPRTKQPKAEPYGQ